jgi:hypothetical protein
MILVLHIAVALASMAAATYVLFNPSKTGLRLNYGLLAGTLASGTYMVATLPVHILQTCMSGLLYVGFVSVLLFVASRRLAAAHDDSKRR